MSNPVTLTPEQEALLPQYCDKWIKVGISTEPAQRDIVEGVIPQIYSAAGQTPPLIYVWALGPIHGVFTAGALRAISPKVGSSNLWEQVGRKVLGKSYDKLRVPVAQRVCEYAAADALSLVRWFDTVVNALDRDAALANWKPTDLECSTTSSIPMSPRCQDAKVDEHARAIWLECKAKVWKTVNQVGKDWQAQKWYFGSEDAPQIAFYQFMQDVVKIDLQGKLDPHVALCENCGWWCPMEEVVILCERPEVLNLTRVGDRQMPTCGAPFRDDDDRPVGPAIRYRDGWELFAIRGQHFPGEAARNRDAITLDRIKGETNAEIARILREYYGDGKYLQDTKAKVIDADEVLVLRNNPNSPSVPRLLLEDEDGQRWFVGTDTSTNRVYYMRCSRENPPKTCREAHSSMMPFGSDDSVGAQS